MFKLNLESIKSEYWNVELNSAPLFDENGSDSYTNQMIIGGKPTGIVTGKQIGRASCRERVSSPV